MVASVDSTNKRGRPAKGKKKNKQQIAEEQEQLYLLEQAK